MRRALLDVDIIYMNYADTTICEFCCCVSREENIFTCWHGMPKHKTWSVRRETMLSQTDINQTPIIWCKCVWKLWLNLCSWQDPLFGRSCKTEASYGGLYSESLGLWWMDAIKERKYRREKATSSHKTKCVFFWPKYVLKICKLNS